LERNRPKGGFTRLERRDGDRGKRVNREKPTSIVSKGRKGFAERREETDLRNLGGSWKGGKKISTSSSRRGGGKGKCLTHHGNYS